MGVSGQVSITEHLVAGSHVVRQLLPVAGRKECDAVLRGVVVDVHYVGKNRLVGKVDRVR